jgi:hypothetical protein
MVKLPCLVESPAAVAVMTSVPLAGTLAGAVYAPELVMLPEAADQTTELL